MAKSHNLDVHMYSFHEILGLFDLTSQQNITMEHMKAAKKKVLMTHPDKSRLPPEYFLFYKKAFDIVVRHYENQNKQNQKVEEKKYEPMKAHDVAKKTVGSVISDMKQEEFQRKFNELFDANMAHKPDSTRNEWFSKDSPEYEMNESVNVKNMGQVFDKIKETQSQTALSKYKGVENLCVGPGSRLHDIDEEEEDDYVTTDPFSKLKYDDLRKVHKDQTVFSVSERDFAKVPKYASTDHLMRERGRQSLNPLEKTDAERLLAQQEQQYRERMLHKQHASSLRTMQYEEKNRAVLSNFLRLT
uniref:J domain-containing protein n=1 Tax=viral metagenome TaxID=1070528 RepID=A0A6C0D352_9ZZZZ